MQPAVFTVIGPGPVCCQNHESILRVILNGAA